MLMVPGRVCKRNYKEQDDLSEIEKILEGVGPVPEGEDEAKQEGGDGRARNVDAKDLQMVPVMECQDLAALAGTVETPDIWKVLNA